MIFPCYHPGTEAHQKEEHISFYQLLTTTADDRELLSMFRVNQNLKVRCRKI